MVIWLQNRRFETIACGFSGLSLCKTVVFKGAVQNHFEIALMSLRAASAQTQCAARYLKRYIDLNGGTANLRLANLRFDCKEIYNRSGLTPIL
jgi:hypothetical protein